jgi:neuropeptide S receptor 1
VHYTNEITYFFLADLMVGIFLVLTDVISKITITWDTGDVGCKIVKFLQAMSTYASTYSLVALSLDRLDVVVRPLKRAGNGMCMLILTFILL